MSADFFAGYISGAIGILVGNPLDVLKTRLQTGTSSSRQPPPPPTGTETPHPKPFNRWTAFARGSAAPILGYGALNALLFVTYNRSLALLTNGGNPDENTHAVPPPAWSLWAAGALGGLATFFVSAPTELVKCRAQVAEPAQSSLEVTKQLWQEGKVRAMYLGGGVTSVRDAVGYGFYFWSYEASKRAITREDDSNSSTAVKVMLCGGLAGVITWASVFPLDVIKSRVQTWDLVHCPNRPPSSESRPLLDSQPSKTTSRPSTFAIAKHAYQTEGLSVFFRGLGICSARAFIVNAVQWAVYEWTMRALQATPLPTPP
ncbi:hypothetical protein MBLNU230_g0874t1 [Neophaeotheca triangularis]